MNPFLIVLLVNLSLALFRIIYVILYPIDLSPEEAQYWDWSRELDLSYYSKPPMVAYLNFLSTHIFGNTEIGVRITPIVLSFILSVLTYFFVRRLFDSRLALLSSVLPNFFIGSAINSLLMTTDAPFLFFWSISVMLIYLAVERNSLKLWISVGIFAGLSFLSKYPAVFLFPLTLLYMFLMRREVLFSVRPYLSLIPAFLLSLPVLIWNLEHNFVSFKHVSSLANKSAHFPDIPSFLEFLGGQVVLLSLFPFLFLLHGWWLSFRERDRRLVFLTTYSLPVVLFFLILSLRKEVYANWSGFAYFTGSILAVYSMARVWKRRKLPVVLSVIFSLFLFILLHFTPLVDRLGLRDLLPPNKDPVKIMIGWEELGREVSGFYTGKELIFSSAYQISAELAFYVEGNPRTFVYHTGRMTQYYLWRGRLTDFKGRDAIFVSYGGLPKGIKKSFASFEYLKRVEVLWRGEVVRRFDIYRLKGFGGDFDETPKGF